MSTEECPACGSDVSGDAKVGVVIPGVYDGSLFWRCAYCGYDWHRFSGEQMMAKAKPHMNLPVPPR